MFDEYARIFETLHRDGQCRVYSEDVKDTFVFWLRGLKCEFWVEDKKDGTYTICMVD